MKLRDLTSGDGTGRRLIEVNGGMEVVVDLYGGTRGTAYVFDDLVVVRSLDDDIERIARYPFAIKDVTLEATGPGTFNVRLPPGASA